jgi:HK97 family phage portal protein
MTKRKNVEVGAGAEVRVSVLKIEDAAASQDQYLDAVATKEQSEGSVIEWPFDPTNLYAVFEESSLLQPNVAAYSANVDLQGQYFSPLVALGTDTDVETIREVLFEDDVLSESPKYNRPADIPDTEITGMEDILTSKHLRDNIRAKSFLRNCGGTLPFSRLRSELRQDLEVTGNGFWEVLRTVGGKLARFVRILPNEIKIMPLSVEKWPIKEHNRKSRIRITTEETSRKVRAYQITTGDGSHYLKEYNCTAFMSSLTGKFFATQKDFDEYNTQFQQGKDVPANEAIHFSLMTNLHYPYGVPRWIGALREVLSTTSISEYNANLFENGLMVPIAILVSGGTLSSESAARLQSFFKSMKGVKNAHRAIVLEATNKTSSVVPTISFETIKGKANEAEFLEYDKRNEDRVGSQFRISDIVRGNTNTTQNRATAEAALLQADQQVFSPVRNEFDAYFTDSILPEIGVVSLELVSKGLASSDPDAEGKLALEAVTRAVLTPNECREILEAVFDREFPQLEEAWANMPLEIYRMGGNTPSMAPAVPVAAPEGGGDGNSPMSVADELARIVSQGRAIGTRLLGMRALQATENSLIDLEG